YVGGEHVLLAAVSTGQPASAVLCAHGLTPARVEEEIVARAGLGAGAGLFGGLDRNALASIGIDIDTVRARIEASFGSQALSAASQAVYADAHRRRRYARWPAPMRRMRRGRRTRRALTSPPGPRPQAAGPAAPYQASGPRPGKPWPATTPMSEWSTSPWPWPRSSAGWCRPSCPPLAHRNRPCAEPSSSATSRRAEPGHRPR